MWKVIFWFRSSTVQYSGNRSSATNEEDGEKPPVEGTVLNDIDGGNDKIGAYTKINTIEHYKVWWDSVWTFSLPSVPPEVFSSPELLNAA